MAINFTDMLCHAIGSSQERIFMLFEFCLSSNLFAHGNSQSVSSDIWPYGHKTSE